MTKTARKRIGEFIILLIYLVVEGYGIWPITHIGALASFVAGFAALLFLDGEFEVRKIVIFTTPVIIISFTIYFISPPILPVETETHGWLIPTNDATPSNACDAALARGIVPKDHLLAIFGGDAAIAPSNAKFTPLKVGSCPVLSMRKDNKGIWIDEDAYDENGNLAFRIRNNEFHRMPQHTSYQDRSADHSEITVYGEKGEELLFVKFLNETTVMFRGIFWCHDPVQVPTIVYNDKIVTSRNNTYSGACAINTEFPPEEASFHLR